MVVCLMDVMSISWMRYTYCMSKVAAVSICPKGYWYYLDEAYFVLLIIWYCGCYLYSEIVTTRLSAQLFDLDTIFVYLSRHLVRVSPIFCIIKFRLMRYELEKLIAQSNEICRRNLHFDSYDFRRRIRLILLVYLFWSSCVLLFTISDLKNMEFAEFVCAFSISCPATLLLFQFFSWILLVSHLFLSVLDQLVRTKRLAMRMVVARRRQMWLTNSIVEIQEVFEMKLKIFQIFGCSLVFNQLRAYFGFIFNFMAVILNTGDGPYFLYHLMKAAFYLVVSYLPYWIDRTSWSEVSWVKIL